MSSTYTWIATKFGTLPRMNKEYSDFDCTNLWLCKALKFSEPLLQCLLQTIDWSIQTTNKLLPIFGMLSDLYFPNDIYIYTSSESSFRNTLLTSICTRGQLMVVAKVKRTFNCHYLCHRRKGIKEINSLLLILSTNCSISCVFNTVDPFIANRMMFFFEGNISLSMCSFHSRNFSSIVRHQWEKGAAWC